MTIHLGNMPASSVLYIPFATYAGATGASVTMTGLAVTDIEIYKNGSVTQRASDAGYVLLDTDGIDFDAITGIHGFSIDLADNTDAGFYAVGSFYWIVVSAVTVDAQTVNFIAATFRIVAAEAISGKPKVDVDGWLGTAASTPTVAGVPNVNAKTWNDLVTVALPLIPTTAGRTLDVSATGEGGLDWANVGSPTTAVNLSGTNIKTDQIVASVSGAVGSVTGAVGSVTGAVGSVTGSVGSVTGAVGSVTGLTAATVHSDLDDIQARLPAALTAGGNMKGDTLAISGSTDAADNLEESAECIAKVTCAALGTTTSVIASSITPASAVNDQLNGRVLLFKNDTTTAALRSQATLISAFNHATQTLTVVALTTAPVSGDLATIL